MYVPPIFRPNETREKNEIDRFCRDHGFATVVSCENGKPVANHFPLLVDPSEGPHGTVLGHMARANPQWRQWGPDTTVTCIFHGPHHYISPAWYRDPLNVPTWNYAVVHLTGRPRLVEDRVGIEAILARLVTHYEQVEGSGWRYDLPEEFRQELVQAIVGFEIEVTEIEAKYKLSQNREEADRQGAITALARLTDDNSRALVQMMRQAR